MRPEARRKQMKRQKEIVDRVRNEIQATEEQAEKPIDGSLHDTWEQPEALEAAAEMRAALADLEAAFAKSQRLAVTV